MDTISLANKTSQQEMQEISRPGPDLLPEGSEISLDELAKRRSFIGLGDSEMAILKNSKSVLMAALPAVLDSFYEKVFAEPEVARFFGTQAIAQGAKSRQNQHWGRITDGVLEGDYLQAALKIDRIHEQIGLEPHWYISS